MRNSSVRRKVCPFERFSFEVPLFQSLGNFGKHHTRRERFKDAANDVPIGQRRPIRRSLT